MQLVANGRVGLCVSQSNAFETERSFKSSFDVALESTVPYKHKNTKGREHLLNPHSTEGRVKREENLFQLVFLFIYVIYYLPFLLRDFLHDRLVPAFLWSQSIGNRITLSMVLPLPSLSIFVDVTSVYFLTDVL